MFIFQSRGFIKQSKNQLKNYLELKCKHDFPRISPNTAVFGIKVNHRGKKISKHTHCVVKSWCSAVLVVATLL